MHTRTHVIRFILVLLAFLSLTALALPAFATTFYVRTDGGTNVQCTGMADARYPGSGNYQACAFSHPFYALAPGAASSNYTPTSVMKPGDKLVIDAGSYMIGYGAPGSDTTMCYTPATWGCTIASIPSGIDAAHPTVITGASCRVPPQLWGTQRVSSIFDIEKAHDITISCLELTDRSNCIENYRPTGNTGGVTACNRNTYPYGNWADYGIYAADVANLTLRNLKIHGFADYGILAGRLSGNTLLDGVTLRANGWGGWSGDLGGNNQSSTDSGTITVQNSTIAYNGCAEAYPAKTIVGCWGQNEGGYGDGFAEAWTGGNWVFTKDSFVRNTQDGLDMLYANGTGSIFMDEVYSGLNAGNGIKTSGAATLQNSVVNAYCNDWAGFPIAGDNSSGVSGTMCRADGTAVVMEFTAPSQTVKVAYSTITGNGDTLFIGGAGNHNFTPGATNVTQLINNIWLGQNSVIPRDGGAPTGLDFYSDSAYHGVVQYTGNIIWKVKNNFCPPGNGCQNPLLSNQTLAAFNPTPLLGSPTIDSASRSYLVNHDQMLTHRPYGPAYDIGAIEFRGQPCRAGSRRPRCRTDVPGK